MGLALRLIALSLLAGVSHAGLPRAARWSHRLSVRGGSAPAATDFSTPVHVSTEEHFDDLISEAAEAGQLVVLDFTATWYDEAWERGIAQRVVLMLRRAASRRCFLVAFFEPTTRNPPCSQVWPVPKDRARLRGAGRGARRSWRRISEGAGSGAVAACPRVVFLLTPCDTVPAPRHFGCRAMARPQVDVDDVAAIAQRYGVSSMPTFVLLRGAGAAAAGADGGPALLGRFSGADPERLVTSARR